MPVGSLGDAALTLYGLPSDEFVNARNALEKQLREEGDRELAARIKALRKPSVAAAALNGIVRANREAVEHLLTTVADLRDTQELIASGEKADLSTMQGQYREAVAALVDGAEDSRRTETQAALEAAAVDPTLHEPLRLGTFVTAPQPTGSFGIPLPTSGVNVGGERPAKRREAASAQAPPSVPDLRLVRAARAKTKAAKDRKEASERVLDEARETLEAVDQRLTALEAELATVREEHRKSEEALGKAERGLARATEEVVKAEEASRRAEA